MANVIQQLMVLIGGDSGGLEGALGTADKTLKEFGLSFAGIIEGLSFSALIAAVVDVGEAFESASIQIQRATGASGEALEGMNASLEKVYATSAQSAGAIASVMTELSIRTGATGVALEELTRETLAFAKVTGTDVKQAVTANEQLFKSWTVDTKDQAAAMDMLYVTSQKTGIGTAQLAQTLTAAGPVLRSLGFSFEESAAMAGKFHQEGLDLEGTLRGLNSVMVALRDSGKDPKQVLSDLAERMKAAATTADALSMAIDAGFAKKAAVAYTDAVRKGALDTAALIDVLNKSGGAVKESADKTVTFSEAWGKLFHQLNVNLAPAGKGLIDFATKSVEGWGKMFSDLKAHVVDFETWVKEHPVAAGILGVGSQVKKPTAGGGASTWNARLGAMVSGPDPADEENLVFNPKTGGFDSQKGPLKPPVPDSLTKKTNGDGSGTGTPPAFDEKRPSILSADALATYNEQLKLADAAYKSVIKDTADFNNAMGASVDPVDLLAIGTALATESLKLFGTAAGKDVIEDTADFNNVIGASIEPVDLLAIKAALAQESLKLFGVTAGKVGGETLTALAKPIDEVNKTFGKWAVGINDANKAAMDDTGYGKLETAFSTLHLSVNSLTGDLENKLVGAFKTVAASDLATASQVEESWGAAGNAINKLAKTDLPSAVSAYQAYIDALKRTGAAIGDIYDAQEKMLTLEIQMKQQRGVSSQAEIIQLTNVQMRTQALKTLSAGLGPIYKGLAQNFDQAFKTLGAGLVAGITGAKTWGQVWKDTLKSIETAILTTLIDAILAMAEAWILNLILGKAVASTTDVAQTTGNIAIASTGAAASQAAIPIIGPALAIAAAAAMSVTLGAIYIPMATFEHGGRVPYDMTATVHKGEYFLPAHDAAMAAAGGGSGVTIHFHGDFTGVTQDLVNTVMNKAVTAARRAGAKL